MVGSGVLVWKGGGVGVGWVGGAVGRSEGRGGRAGWGFRGGGGGGGGGARGGGVRGAGDLQRGSVYQWVAGKNGTVGSGER